MVFGKETSYSCGPGYRRHPVTCRLLVSQKAFPQRDVLSCAEDRTGQEAPPVDSCALILLEPRLLRPKYMQRGDSARPKPVLGCTPSRQEGPFFAVTALKNLKMPWKMLPDSTMVKRREGCLRFTLEGPQEDSVSCGPGNRRRPTPVDPAIGDIL